MTEELRRYNSIAMILHWVIAALILANLAVGIFLDDMEGQLKFQMFQLHKSFGITVLLLTVLRIVWRLAFKPPAIPTYVKKWERAVAATTYFLLYVLMFMVPFTGWALVSSSAMHVPTVLYGVVLWPDLPNFKGLDPAALKQVHENIGDTHAVLAYAMLGLVVLHAGAAMRHHFILRDQILLRMTPRWAEGLLKWIRLEKP